MTTSLTRRGLLAAAPSIKIVSLPSATHFADRPERGRDCLLAELTSHFGNPLA